MLRFRFLSVLLPAMALVACGPIVDRSEMVRPSPNQQARAGVGDVVFELRKRESLPDSDTGGADIFGGTRDTGSVTLRYAGMKDGRAWFVRSDVSIHSDETTASRTSRYVPVTQYSTATGTVGTTPFQGSGTTTGMIVLPPKPVSRTVSQSGDMGLSAPIGGTLPIAGHTLTVIAADDSSVTYSVR